MADDRLEEFKADIAGQRIKEPVAGRDTMMARVGAVLMVTGVVVALFAYFASHSTTNPLDQSDDTIIALIGIAVTIAGAAAFLRYSLGGFLRFWMARLVLEQRVQTDRLLEGRPPATVSGTTEMSQAGLL